MQSILILTSLVLTVTYADCHLCWPPLLMTVTYADCHLCWLSLLLTVTYADCHLCWLSLMLTVTYADFHLCWLSLMLTVNWLSLCWLSLMLTVIYAECHYAVCHLSSVIIKFHWAVLEVLCWVWARNPYWTERLSTNGLLELTNWDQLIFLMKIL